MVGELIADRYELEELLGSGGHSSVYRAHDTLLERHVALKVLHDHFLADEVQVERFRREARAVAQLSHPNIVSVIDRGERDGRQFIVFEHVDGDDLKELVQRVGPLPERRALGIALQVAHALAFAHRQGLVHRDVKPQNIILSRSGEVKVTDFGIARDLDVKGATQTGAVLGTSDYIAPEQARGDAVDARTDVYSLGVVLYELLTGEVPFRGDNFIAVAMRHVTEPPPSVRAVRAEVSERVDAVLRRAMAKEPHERQGSMDELIDDLEDCLVELEPEAEALAEETLVTLAASPRVETTRRTEPETLRDAEAPPPKKPARRLGRRLAILGLVLAALGALGLAAALAFVGRDSKGTSGPGTATRETTTTAPTAEGRAVPLAAAGVYDPPPGDGQENDAAVGNAVDRDPSTFWSTEGYDDGLAAIGKKGVGIVLDAGRAVAGVRFTVISDTPGFRARIEGGASPDGGFRALSSLRRVGRSTSFSLDGSDARYFVVWITELARPDRYRAHVNEVRLEAAQ